MEKNKPYQGKQPQGQKCGAVFQKRPFRGMYSSNNGYKSDIKCFYNGKNSHLAKFYFKRQTYENGNKQRKHKGHFADEGHSHDLRLFIVDYSLSVLEEDEVETWFVDSGAS